MFSGILSWFGIKRGDEIGIAIESGGSGDMDLDIRLEYDSRSKPMKKTPINRTSKLVLQQQPVATVQDKVPASKRNYSVMDAQTALDALSKNLEISQRDPNYLSMEKIAHNNNMSRDQLKRLVTAQQHQISDTEEVRVLKKGRPTAFPAFLIAAVQQKERASGTIESYIFSYHIIIHIIW
jgi:hypothetical protein